MHEHHDHDNNQTRRRLGLTVIVVATVMVAEFVGGYLSGSLALLADAGHMLTDTLALLVSLVALVIAAKPADARRTFGYRRVEILAALVNAVALLGISISIAFEAYARWQTPRPIAVGLMSGVAAVGLLANLLGMWLLRSEGHNLNTRAAYLHIIGDTLTSVGVLVAALVMVLTGWIRVDAVVSFVIAAIIMFSAVRLLREVSDILLEAAPRGIDTVAVRKTLEGICGVDGVHSLHIWSITSGLPALSVHVVVADASRQSDEVLHCIRDALRREYHIAHLTVQVERKACAGCDCFVAPPP